MSFFIRDVSRILLATFFFAINFEAEKQTLENFEWFLVLGKVEEWSEKVVFFIHITVLL